MASSSDAAWSVPAASHLESTAWYRLPGWLGGEVRGVLRLADGRLSFVDDAGTVQVDAPVHELHSVHSFEMGSGIEIWHGRTRHRLLLTDPRHDSSHPVDALDGVLGPLDSVEAADHAGVVRAVRPLRKRWLRTLEPLVAPSPPEGVHVRSPMSGPVQVLLVVLLSTVVLVAIIAVAVVTSS